MGMEVCTAWCDGNKKHGRVRLELASRHQLARWGDPSRWEEGWVKIWAGDVGVGTYVANLVTCREESPNYRNTVCVSWLGFSLLLQLLFWRHIRAGIQSLKAPLNTYVFHQNNCWYTVRKFKSLGLQARVLVGGIVQVAIVTLVFWSLLILISVFQMGSHVPSASVLSKEAHAQTLLQWSRGKHRPSEQIVRTLPHQLVVTRSSPRSIFRGLWSVLYPTHGIMLIACAFSTCPCSVEKLYFWFFTLC